MRTEAFASPLTVWVGPRYYTFPPGRDVTVGHDSRCDVRLDGTDPSTSPTHVVLHHDGRQWVAIDRSQRGIYVDGVRMSTVLIRDGRAITLGDPRHGLRLVFQIGGPGAPAGHRDAPPSGARPGPPPAPRQPPPRPGPPAPAMPAQPPRSAAPSRSDLPSQSPTRAFRTAQPQPDRNQLPSRPVPAPPQRQSGTGATASSYAQLPTHRFPAAQPKDAQPRPAPAAPPPAGPPEPVRAHPAPAEDRFAALPAVPALAERTAAGLVERMTRALHRLVPRRAQPDPHDDSPTGPLPRADVSAEAPPRSRSTSDLGTLQAYQLWLNVDGRQVLADVSCSAQPGTLTAVIGPSAAARSGLANILGGAMRPSYGVVTVGGHDPHGEDVRPHIGMVPQEDLVHPQLTVEQALGYLAELGLPPDTSAADRRGTVDQVIRVVELASVRTVQVGTLSREQRKRASVAAALITRPTLLVLDEPTAGLEPAAQRRVMALLRRLADAGHTIVASTAAAGLDECHQTVLLTAAGTTAFIGPPAEVATVLGTADWSQIYTTVAEDPEGAHQRFLARKDGTPPEQPPAAAVEPLEPPARLSLGRQIAVAARRQAWLIVGDQRYFVFLTLLPLLFGGLVLVVPGHAGLGPADPYGNSPDQGLEILAVLIFAAIFMGTALTIRDVFAERFLFRREQDNGLSPTAYLAAKIGVYSVVASVQSAIITTVAVAGKGGPNRDAVLLGSPAFELYLAVLLTAVVSAIGALALSSLARYAEQLLLMAVLVILVSMILSGSAFPLANRFLLEEISWLVPARWGFAAAASAVDLHTIDPLAHDDASWHHSAGWWLFDMAMLVAFGVALTAFLRWRLRRLHEPEPVSQD